MKKFSIFFAVSLIWLFSSTAFAQHHAPILEEQNSEVTPNEAVAPVESPIDALGPVGIGPVSILENILKESQETSPTPPDVTYLVDPGNPDAPIDSKIWILFSLIVILGIIQYRKSKSVSSI